MLLIASLISTVNRDLPVHVLPRECYYICFVLCQCEAARVQMLCLAWGLLSPVHFWGLLCLLDLRRAVRVEACSIASMLAYPCQDSHCFAFSIYTALTLRRCCGPLTWALSGFRLCVYSRGGGCTPAAHCSSASLQWPEIAAS